MDCFIFYFERSFSILKGIKDKIALHIMMTSYIYHKNFYKLSTKIIGSSLLGLCSPLSGTNNVIISIINLTSLALGSFFTKPKTLKNSRTYSFVIKLSNRKLLYSSALFKSTFNFLSMSFCELLEVCNSRDVDLLSMRSFSFSFLISFCALFSSAFVYTL